MYTAALHWKTRGKLCGRRTEVLLSTGDQLSSTVNITFTPCARHHSTICSSPNTKSQLYFPANAWQANRITAALPPQTTQLRRFKKSMLQLRHGESCHHAHQSNNDPEFEFFDQEMRSNTHSIIETLTNLTIEKLQFTMDSIFTLSDYVYII